LKFSIFDKIRRQSVFKRTSVFDRNELISTIKGVKNFYDLNSKLPEA